MYSDNVTAIIVSIFMSGRRLVYSEKNENDSFLEWKNLGKTVFCNKMAYLMPLFSLEIGT